MVTRMEIDPALDQRVQDFLRPEPRRQLRIRPALRPAEHKKSCSGRMKGGPFADEPLRLELERSSRTLRPFPISNITVSGFAGAGTARSGFEERARPTRRGIRTWRARSAAFAIFRKIRIVPTAVQVALEDDGGRDLVDHGALVLDRTFCSCMSLVGLAGRQALVPEDDRDADRAAPASRAKTLRLFHPGPRRCRPSGAEGR